MNTKIWIPLLAGLACNSDNAAKIVNSAPEATITVPSDGDALMEGETVYLRGTVSDNNHANDELTASWNSGAVPLCPATTPESDGTVQCEIVVFEDLSEITLSVLDPSNQIGLDTVTVTTAPSNAPTINVLSPQSTEVYYSDQLIYFAALIEDSEDTPEDLTTVWSSDIDGELPFTALPDTNGQIEQYLYLSEGQHALTATVTDTSGKTASETVAIDIGGPNVEPACEITEPLGGSSFIYGQNIQFVGTATDENINNSLLSISWESSIDGIFSTIAANTAGELTVVTDLLDVGNHIITLTVQDEVGALCTDTVAITVSTPPTLTITAPTANSVHTLGDAVVFTGTVSDQEDILSDISVSWSSDIDGTFSTTGADSNGSISFSFSELSAGLHNIYVTATDTSGLTSSTSLPLLINTPPDQPLLTITPDPATTLDGLTVTISGPTDADGDPVTYTHEWRQNGNPTSYASSSVPMTATAAQEEWTVLVTPNDGYVDGTTAEASIIVSNSPPSIDNIGITPSNFTNDDTIYCTATATDADQSLTPDFLWTVGSLTFSGSSLDLSTLTVMPGEPITCTASVVDAFGEQAELSVSSSAANRPPTVGSVSITPTQAFTNSSLECLGSASDPDGETPTVSIEWLAGGNSIGSGPTINLDNTLVSVGDTVSCTITATDAMLETNVGTATITVDNTVPTIVDMTLTPTSPTENDTLTCTATTADIDGNTPVTIFEWTNLTTGVVHASTSSSATSATLDLSLIGSISPNDDIVCSFTVDDTNGGVVSQSEQVTVINSAPQFTVAASISPTMSAWAGTLMTCDSEATDLVDGTITPTFEWSVNGVVIATGPTYTIDHADVVPTQTLVCTATATDSDGESVQSTDSIDVVNAPPEITSVTLLPSTPNAENTITASVVTNDLNGDTVTLGFSWEVNGTPVQSGPDNFLTPTVGLHTFGDLVTVTVGANDGTDSSALVSSSVNVVNAPPTDPTIDLIPSSPIENSDDLVCSVTGPSTDPDGTTPTYEFQWMIDGVNNFTNATDSSQSSTVDRSFTVAGDVWTCTVLATDGNASSNPVSLSVTVAPEGGDEVFDYTGNVDTFTVPSGVTQITVEAYGGQGGNGTNGSGGPGGYVLAEGIPVVPGDSYEIRVGGQGQSGNGALGGIFDGGEGAYGSSSSYGGGGGGGSSDIRPSGGGPSDRIVVAGGGGGGGADGCTAQGLTGGSGGGIVGGSGEQGNGCNCNPSGTGGTETSGGDVGTWACGSNCNAQAGGFGVGGNGNTTSTCGGTTGGGGGGGGWHGGGGGGLGAGGGGSSYATTNASAVTHNQGINFGNGQIIISW